MFAEQLLHQLRARAVAHWEQFICSRQFRKYRPAAASGARKPGLPAEAASSFATAASSLNTAAML
jgi:hypothetical protein